LTEAWGADENGVLSYDPEQIVSLLPIGDYKGFGLSMMVDILSGLLSGMPVGDKVSSMYGNPLSEKRYLGHFFVAIKIECFEEISNFKKRLSELMKRLRSEPTRVKGETIMVAGDPEKKAYRERREQGIPLSETEYRRLREIENNFGVALEG